MNERITVECNIRFLRRGRGFRKEFVNGAEPPPQVVETGRIPRVTRLMALAIRLEQLLRSGQIASYAQLAELGHVTRARLTQIMNLLVLAPDLQEQLLFLPRVERGQRSILLRQLQPIALTPDWRRQRRLWKDLWR
jgi:hypothetical protein